MSLLGIQIFLSKKRIGGRGPSPPVPPVLSIYVRVLPGNSIRLAYAGTAIVFRHMKSNDERASAKYE
jgi:hypothetical protein